MTAQSHPHSVRRPKLGPSKGGPLPLRESNKAEKRQRIRVAAQNLFAAQGFDATTMRQIADKAHVALGTLSLYADDKRDLALMIFVDKAGELNNRARAAAQQKDLLIDRLVSMFSIFAQDAAKNIKLARIHHQLSYHATGRHAEAYYAFRSELFATVEVLLREALERGEITTDEDLSFVARQVFFNFSAGLRWWAASETPRLSQCLDDLQRIMRLLINGLKPKSIASTGSSNSTVGF